MTLAKIASSAIAILIAYAAIGEACCLNAAPNEPQLTIKKTDSEQGTFIVGQQFGYTISVGNAGPGNTGGGQVTLVDPMPTGFQLTEIISGSDWNCASSTSTQLLCTNTSNIAAGNSFSNVTALGNVLASAPDTVTNTAIVNGTGVLSAQGSDGPSTVIHQPILSATVTDSGNGTFAQGDTGRTFTVSVQNSGLTTSGTTTAVLTLSDATALVPTGVSGGWTCGPLAGTITCTNSSTIALGQAFPSIILTVNVAASATSPQSLSVAVTGGGSVGTATGSDTVTINRIANISSLVSVTQFGFVRNRATGLWSATMTLTNTSASAISGPIQVLFNGLPVSVTMTNNTGIRNGNPYLTVVPSGSLAPGGSVSVTIQFSNPGNVFITYTPETDMVVV